MIKKIILLLVSFAFGAGAAMAQVPDSINMSLNNVSIPTSPGFILLDESPTIIDHPESPRAFVTSIYNTYKQTGGFPSNYGVEFTPFWFFKHNRMTALKYIGYNPETQKQMPFSHIKKASFSLAYVNQPDTGSAGGISNIAIGVRTTLISIRSQKNIQAIKEANQQVVISLRAINEEIIQLDPLQPDYNDKVKEIIDNYENNEQLLDAEEQLRKQLEVKPVFAVDAAFAYSTFFLDNTFSEQHFGRLGIWTVLNYSQSLGSKPVPNNYLNIYGIFRYLQDGTTKDTSGSWQRTSSLDFGAKAELELNKFSLGGEYILRERQDEPGSTYRLVGMLSYRLSPGLALTASFGKNFGDQQNLITLFGLSFGINSGNENALVKN